MDIEFPDYANKRQRATINALVRLIIYSERHRTIEREWKLVRFTQEGSRLFLLLERGMVGDEGTFAQTLARDSWHWYVGPRGGIKTLSRNWKEVYASDKRKRTPWVRTR